MGNKKVELIDKDSAQILWRLGLSVIGIVLAAIFFRDRKQAIKEYEELKSQSPFIAWLIKWAFIALMLITISTIVLFIRVFYELSK